jgi:RsiW-degrading membrane proteinase PrsW (M82 family)
MANQLLNSPQFFALIVGFAPSLFWLVFWLQTDKDNPEPFWLLFTCFLIGGMSVYFATLTEQTLKGVFTDPTSQIVAFAAVEEILKFLVFYLIAYKSSYNDEAIDPAIYMIAVALGFAALENIFYVLQPSVSINTTAILLTGGLRFFGSTLLHTISSCFVGIMIGISPKKIRGLAIIFGLIGAIFLHATFNFFILKKDTASTLQIYGYLWIAAIISHIILEKLRRIPMHIATTGEPIQS